MKGFPPFPFVRSWRWRTKANKRRHFFLFRSQSSVSLFLLLSNLEHMRVRHVEIYSISIAFQQKMIRRSSSSKGREKEEEEKWRRKRVGGGRRRRRRERRRRRRRNSTKKEGIHLFLTFLCAMPSSIYNYWAKKSREFSFSFFSR